MIAWTARCKSGFTFNGRACRRACSRGELLCADCATAEVIPASPRPLPFCRFLPGLKEMAATLVVRHTARRPA